MVYFTAFAPSVTRRRAYVWYWISSPPQIASWAYVGPTLSRQDPRWANVEPTKFAARVDFTHIKTSLYMLCVMDVFIIVHQQIILTSRASTHHVQLSTLICITITTKCIPYGRKYFTPLAWRPCLIDCWNNRCNKMPLFICLCLSYLFWAILNRKPILSSTYEVMGSLSPSFRTDCQDECVNWCCLSSLHITDYRDLALWEFAIWCGITNGLKAIRDVHIKINVCTHIYWCRFRYHVFHQF